MEEFVFFLPYIIFLGIITSYTDAKYGKIRNKWLVLGLIYAFLVYTALIVYSFLSPSLLIIKKYIVEIATNFLFSALLGFFLWHYRIWTAGDGKLFITYSFLLPPSVYSLGYYSTKWTPSITLFLNTFVLCLLFLVFFAFNRTNAKKFAAFLKGATKNFFDPRALGEAALIIFAILWVVQFFLGLLDLKGNIFLTIILVILASSLIKEKIKKDYWWVMFPIVLLRMIVDKSIYSFNFLIGLVALIALWALLSQFFGSQFTMLNRDLFSREIKVSELKEGMLLAESIMKKGNKIRLEPKNLFLKKGFIEDGAEGLTKEQIAKIKGMKLDKVRISKTIPFAPILFLGVIITILCRGNIFIWFKLIILS